MAVRVRILPQWLVSLGKGNRSCKVKTGKSKNHGHSSQMKSVSARYSNDNYSSGIKSGMSSITSGEEISRNKEISKSCNESSPTLLTSSSENLVDSSGTRSEMSDCEEEVVMKSDSVSLEGEIKDKNLDMSNQKRSTHLCLKKENESSNETEDELVPSAGIVVESRNHEDSTFVKEPLRNSTSCTEVNAHPGSSVFLSSVTTADNIDIDTDINNMNETENGQQSYQNITDNVTQIVRPKCYYGKQCYRKNSQHRQDFSHPEDDDYAAVDNRKECEYGLACYRKNPLHRQHYKHTQKFQKPRQTKRPRKKLVNNASDDEDDYDLDDPFINDGSSDDYEPSASDSETDFEAEEEETKSGNTDSKLKVKETKKPVRKRRY